MIFNKNTNGFELSQTNHIY